MELDSPTVEQAYAAQIHDYVKNTMLPADATDADVENGYANVRIWLDSKGITSEGIAYIDANKEEAYAVATGPDYAGVLEAQGKTIPAASAPVAVKQKTDIKKLAFLAAAIGLVIWFLFFKESDHSVSAE